MTFNSTVFERLLFPLNNQVYRQIQDALDKVDRERPGQLQRILAQFGNAAHSDTQTPTWMPGKADETAYPSLDITVFFDCPSGGKLSTLRKSTGCKIGLIYDEKPAAKFAGSHLSVGFYNRETLNTFITPLEYLLGFNEKPVLGAGSYQLYCHRILSPGNRKIIARQVEAVSKAKDYSGLSSIQRNFQNNSLVYVGITKRTWQERYRQHCRDSGRGSNLLFHRALRGEMGKIGVIEHIVERAGLTEKQALEIEEREVEKRSLHSLYPNGLNMIPGGNAGLKCIHYFAARTGYALPRELTADAVEPVLVEVQRHLLNRHFSTADIKRVNAEIARLWAEDTGYRINVMTNRHNRLSFRQIQAARTWHASGWPLEKIFARLQKMDSREISMEQLEKLLRGETYSSIPEVLM